MPKSSNLPHPAERLNFLVDKITTSGKFEPDRELTRELCERCCESVSTIQQVFRLLRVQLTREHAQIRQGVLQLLTNLSDPTFMCAQVNPDAVKPEIVPTVCKTFRDLVLRDLQAITSYLLRTEDEAPVLPRPVEIARQVERQLIELVLNWEEDMKHGQFGAYRANESHDEATTSASSKPNRVPWAPSAQSRGQLTSFLSFLRCTVPPGRSASGLPRTEMVRVQQLVRDVERSRAQTKERARKQRDQAIRKERKRVTQCLSRIKDSADLIEENLTSLTNTLELLVPDPFESTGHSPHPSASEGVKVNSSSNPIDTLREHGVLLGSSSGLGLSSAQGSIEIRLPGCLSSSAHQGSVRNAFVSVPVELDESSRILADTARECALLARDKHQPLLLSWIEVLGSTNLNCLSESDIQVEVTTQLARVQSWLERINRLIHLYFDRILFTENGHPVHSKDQSTIVDGDSEDSSDLSDLEEVRSPNPVSVRSPSHEDRTRPVISSTQTNSTTPPTPTSCPSASLTPNTHSPTNTETSNRTVRNSDALRIPITATHEPSRPKSTLAQSLFDVVPSKSSVIWRSNESAHKFWRPIDPEEHEAPREYYEDAISLTTNTVLSGVKDNVSCDPTGQSSTNIMESADISFSPSDPPSASVNRLACWAPLLMTSSAQTKRLCPRRDPSGRCPIHGRIVRRDPNTGRPIDPHDREQLQAEVMATRKAKLEAKEREAKRLSRRRYPGLVDLNARPRGARNRLRSRVLSPHSIRNVLDTLNAADERDVASRFSDNFVHAVQPR